MARSHAEHLPEGFDDAVKAMGEAELRTVIVSSSKTIGDTLEARDSDPKFIQLRDDLKVVRDGYGGVVKTQKAKIALAIFTLKERGVDLSR